MTESPEAKTLSNKITEQGNVVRKLKAEKSEKSNIDDAVKVISKFKFILKLCHQI